MIVVGSSEANHFKNKIEVINSNRLWSSQEFKVIQPSNSEYHFNEDFNLAVEIVEMADQIIECGFETDCYKVTDLSNEH